MLRIAALLTSYNRREKTLSCIRALYKQWAPAGTEVSVFLADDASPDDTADAVRSMFPSVTLLRGDGNLYWCGGMRLAFAEALKNDFDFYLWVNDDTDLVPDALRRLVETHDELRMRLGRSPIVVGCICDPQTSRLTYGGVVRASRIHPLKYRCLELGIDAQPCDTMNGNCVLIPGEAARLVGNIDRFTQGMGDLDYGLRARRMGVPVWVARGRVGSCSRNPRQGTWEDPTLSLLERWRRVRMPKGLPPREYGRYSRRHGGPLWPLFWSLPYIRLAMIGVGRRR
jgi:GT2 family glycosyltransferase